MEGRADQIFVVRQMFEKFGVKGKKFIWNLMDREKAYDHVGFDVLLQVLWLYRVDNRLLKFVQRFYRESCVCVRVHGKEFGGLSVKAR